MSKSRKPGRQADYDAAYAPRFEPLERRAIVNGWAVPEAKKKKIVKRLVDILDPKSPEGKVAKLRYVLIAARTLMSADLRQQTLELAREIAAGGRVEGTLADLVGEAELRADELDRDTEHQGPAGEGPAGGSPGAVPE
jgi:hypothetical protein